MLVGCAASCIPFGAWVIANSRFPAWFKGAWKWPLGDSLSPSVANLYGWANLLVGAASLVLLVPVVRLPQAGAVSRVGVAVAVLFVLIGVAAYLRSTLLSYQTITEPSNARPALAKESLLALGLVAGLAWGALLAAAVVDAISTGSSEPAATASEPRPDGVQWTDIKVGSGTPSRPGKTLTVSYTVWLGDGTRIDSSSDHGGTFTFTMGRGDVIKGLDLGVVGMRAGGIRWLTIPPELAYGASGVQGSGPSIPPNATLVFVVELLAVTP